MKHFKETKYYYWDYEPIFEKYVDVEIDDYDDCGHKIGFHIESRGINQIGKKLVKHRKTDLYYFSNALEKLVKPYIENNLERKSLFNI